MKRIFTIFAAAFLAGTAAFSQNTSKVSFDLCYDTDEQVAPVIVQTGRMMPQASKPLPVREGYRFGGWYTSPECKPENEWRFGVNSNFFVPATDSMKVEKSMTLYAKWVSPTPIRTVEEFDAIRKDLYGWYVLENDLDLSGIDNWVPIGEYEGPYEFADGEWWRYAFKGVLDGQGHTIRGLRITEILTDKNGLFGTIANGVIKNLNMEDSRLVFEADKPYVGPLAGILKQDERQVCEVVNCRITGTLIKVKTTNKDFTFHSFTGLCGGAWGGTLKNNFVSGKMDIEIGGNGGEFYAGAYLGEAYNNTIDCSSDYEINVRIINPQPKGGFKAYIGGLQASATNIEGCTAKGSINISGAGAGNEVFVGGLVGSERYGSVKNSNSTIKIGVRDMDFVQVGGVVGEFNAMFGAIGIMFGNNVISIDGCSYAGKPVYKNVKTVVWGEAVGAPVTNPQNMLNPGMPAPEYQINNCKYKTR